MSSIEEKEKSLNMNDEKKAPADADQKKPAFSGRGKVSLMTTVAVGLAAVIIGGVIGYSVKPVAKTQDLVVTEDVSEVIAENNGTSSAGTASADKPAKTYTQITDIMDNARHVVEESFYASDGSIVACEDGYAIMRKDYDEKGNLVSTSYFDTADQPFFVEKFKEEIPRYMVKHQVRPGLTGWAQVNGYRGDTSIRKRIDYDIYYIENWTIGFDIKIIFMTFFTGFINKNAY